LNGFTPLGMRVVVLALAAFALRAEGSTQAGAAIHVTPSAVVEGDPVSVTITGLKPGQEIVLHACRLWDLYPKGSEAYYSRTTFVADAGGSVSTISTRPLINGGEAPADPSRPFWSMSSVRLTNSVPPAASCDVASLRADEVELAVEAGGQLVARATAMMATAGPGVTITEVQTADVVGVFAAPPAGSPRPGVILLGGSEGGLFTARSLAPLFASHGFATLGVGYFGGDLPGRPGNLALIPVETVEHARQWLHAQPGVDPTRIAIIGVSKGAELALVAASQYRWIDVVAAFAPSHVVWEGIPPVDRAGGPAVSSWTISGRPLPFVRWSYAAEARATEARKATRRSRLTEAHLESLAEFAGDVERATIPIERSRAAFLLVAGIDDGMWPAAYSVDRIQARLARHRYDRPVKVVRLATGHQVLGSGWAPTTAFNRETGRLQGGDPQLDARGQAESWAELLEFLRVQLR
jgi:dienelactone hydrolase